ncbi:MAG: bifunctional riboflavin kinase/FAD synthetase [Acidobacteriota bacterium]
MILLKDLDRIPPLTAPVILTIGNFDGLHRGHKRILRKVISRAREEGGTSVVVTFEPHPLKVLYPERAPQLIQTLSQKRDILAHLGIQVLLEVPFTAEFGRLPADAFVRLLCERLAPQEIYIGDDFRFGFQRAGDITFLKSLASELGYEAHAFAKLKVDGVEVSSSTIRRLLLEGEMERAVRLLGRPYIIEGVVAHGDGRGKELGYPTANLSIENELIPARGVYVVAVDDGDPLLRPAVANLGVRPTFGEGEVTVEVHILEGGGDLYGRRIRCLFFQFLRPERKFPSPGALKAQIAEDVERAKAYFADLPLARRMFY